MTNSWWPFQILAMLLLAPFLQGVVNRTKAFYAGRKGQPLLQPYFDLWKLLHKGAVYSRTTGRVFRLGPVAALAAVAAAATLSPWGALPAPVAFPGDWILLAYLLGLARFLTVSAALDTGSSFEGMGASREVFFSALAEPALFLCLMALAKLSGAMSLSAIFAGITPHLWITHGAAPGLALVALFVVFLAENSRIPVDDPTTHLELTMIHEVMVLDHSGPDFALIQYGAALKFWPLGSLIAGILPLRPEQGWLAAIAFVVCMLALAIAVGVIESIMARLKLNRVPQVLVGACALASLALFLVF